MMTHDLFSWWSVFLKFQYKYIEFAREAAKKRGLGVMLYSIFFLHLIEKLCGAQLSMHTKAYFI